MAAVTTVTRFLTELIRDLHESHRCVDHGWGLEIILVQHCRLAGEAIVSSWVSTTTTSSDAASIKSSRTRHWWLMYRAEEASAAAAGHDNNSDRPSLSRRHWQMPVPAGVNISAMRLTARRDPADNPITTTYVARDDNEVTSWRLVRCLWLQ